MKRPRLIFALSFFAVALSAGVSAYESHNGHHIDGDRPFIITGTENLDQHSTHYRGANWYLLRHREARSFSHLPRKSFHHLEPVHHIHFPATGPLGHKVVL